jgi:ribose transport system ATP-binding protein
MKKIVCENIKKHFGGIKALQGASLDLKAGEIRALFGGNGSGKSTLSKILGGVLAPDSGKIFIDDKEVKINSPMKAKQLGIIITSQELSLFDNLSIENNILLNKFPKKSKYFINRNKINDNARLILQELQISDILSFPVKKLPENKKYLLEFAKALAQEPKFLIVDEITSALFTQDFEIVRNALFKLRDKGLPIIFISHRMNEIYNICDTVTVMRNGMTIGTYDLKSIDKEELLDLMTGKKSEEDKDSIYDNILYKEKNKNNNISYNENIKKEKVKKDTNNYLLKLENLKLKSFSKQISLNIMPGEFIGLSGLQGQGQSELVRTIFGLNESFELNIKGKKVVIDSPIKSIKHGFAFISGNRQTEGVFSDRSVQENLDVVHDIIFSRGKVNYQTIIDQLEIVVNNLTQLIKSLSGGNQQKVVIGRWICTEPLILLADDPNKGVDVQARCDVHKIFKKLIDSGKTIIMASSDDEELVDISRLIPNTRILIFYNGIIVRTLLGEDINVKNIISASLAKGV